MAAQPPPPPPLPPTLKQRVLNSLRNEKTDDATVWTDAIPSFMQSNSFLAHLEHHLQYAPGSYPKVIAGNCINHCAYICNEIMSAGRNSNIVLISAPDGDGRTWGLIFGSHGFIAYKQQQLDVGAGATFPNKSIFWQGDEELKIGGTIYSFAYVREFHRALNASLIENGDTRKPSKPFAAPGINTVNAQYLVLVDPNNAKHVEEFQLPSTSNYDQLIIDMKTINASVRSYTHQVLYQVICARMTNHSYDLFRFSENHQNHQLRLLKLLSLYDEELKNYAVNQARVPMVLSANVALLPCYDAPAEVLLYLWKKRCDANPDVLMLAWITRCFQDLFSI